MTSKISPAAEVPAEEFKDELQLAEEAANELVGLFIEDPVDPSTIFNPRIGHKQEYCGPDPTDFPSWQEPNRLPFETSDDGPSEPAYVPSRPVYRDPRDYDSQLPEEEIPVKPEEVEPTEPKTARMKRSLDDEGEKPEKKPLYFYDISFILGLNFDSWRKELREAVVKVFKPATNPLIKFEELHELEYLWTRRLKTLSRAVLDSENREHRKIQEELMDMKYIIRDFLVTVWNQNDKLDVKTNRFVVYPDNLTDFYLDTSRPIRLHVAP